MIEDALTYSQSCKLGDRAVFVRSPEDQLTRNAALALDKHQALVKAAARVLAWHELDPALLDCLGDEGHDYHSFDEDKVIYEPLRNLLDELRVIHGWPAPR